MTVAEFPMSIYRVSLRRAIPGAITLVVIGAELLAAAYIALRVVS